MDLTLEIVGQIPKRRLIPRGPTGDRLLDEIESWLPAGGSGARPRDPAPRPRGPAIRSWRVAFHPAASDVVVRASKDGRVVVSAVTSAVGPGYHTYLCTLVERLGVELGIAWSPIGRTGRLPGRRRRLRGRRPARRPACRRGARPSRLAGEDARFGPAGPAAPARAVSRWGCRSGSATGSRGRSRPPSGHGTTPGWSGRWPILGSPSTSCPGGPTPPTVASSSTGPCTLMWTQVRWRSPGLEGERELLDEVAQATLAGLSARSGPAIPVARVAGDPGPARRRRPGFPAGRRTGGPDRATIDRRSATGASR